MGHERLTREELIQQMMAVGGEAKGLAVPHVLGIYDILSETEAELKGTATFIQIRDRLYALSADHVLRSQGPLGVFGGNGQGLLTLPYSPCLSGLPLDIGFCRLPDEVRTMITGRFPASVWSFAELSDPHYDYYMIVGLPGARSRFLALLEGVVSKVKPYTTFRVTPERVTLRKYFDPIAHFALDYPVEAIRDEHGDAVDWIDPAGYSGSAVWGLRKDMVSGPRARCSKGEIVGVVTRWDPMGKCLIATRVEHVLSFIDRALHEEAAYYRWFARGCPRGDDWADWFAVDLK